MKDNNNKELCRECLKKYNNGTTGFCEECYSYLEWWGYISG